LQGEEDLMGRTCYICGGALPEKAKGSFCSRECFEIYKQVKAQNPAPPSTSTAKAEAPPPPDYSEEAQTPSPAEQTRSREPDTGPVPSFAQAAGKGAYRRKANSYLGVIVSERQRSTNSGGPISEWTIRDALGGTVHVPKNQVKIGEPPDRAETDPLREGTGAVAAFLQSDRVRMVREAPLRVKLIGGAFIYLGAIGLWTGLAGLFLFLFFSGIWNDDKVLMPSEIAWLEALAAFLAGASLLAVVAGYKLLRLRAWARLALEILAWTAVAAGIIGAGYALIGSQSTAFSGMVRAVVFFNILFMAGLWLAPFLTLLHFLRDTPTRRAARR